MQQSILRGQQTDYERDSSVGAVFDAIAAGTPDAIAINDGRRTLSYAETCRHSNRIAHFLVSRGVRPGTRVGVAVDRSVDLATLLLGILKAGGAYVPLDLGWPAQRLAFTLADAGVELVVRTASTVELSGVAVLDLDLEADLIDASPTTPPLVSVAADDVAYVMYTSGSTGTPKGVEILHRGIVRLVRGADYVKIAVDDTILLLAPLAFDASTFEIWGALLNGAAVAIAPPRNLSFSEIGACLRAFRVSVLWLTAPLFGAIVRSNVTELAGLRCLVTGGDVVPPEDARTFLRTFPGCELVDGYGPTENTTFSCCYRVPSADSIGASIPIGKPIAHSTAYVLDEALRPVPIGTTGELFVGGDGVARGYTDQALTKERFLSDPFATSPSARMYRTGDRARLRDDGQLEFLGRVDRQVKIRGHRIELEEIERALAALPGVAEAAVVVSAEPSDAKLLVAFVARAEVGPFDAHGVRESLAATLPSYMIPHRIECVRELQKTASGKIDRASLELAARRPAPPATSGMPRNRRALVASISACWVEALGVGADADVDVNFFDAGGDSLRLLSLHSALRRALDIEVTTTDLFAHSTIAKQVAFFGRS